MNNNHLVLTPIIHSMCKSSLKSWVALLMLVCTQVPRAVFIKFSRTARPEFLNKLPPKGTGDPLTGTQSRFFHSPVVDSPPISLSFRDLYSSMHQMWCREFLWFRSLSHATLRGFLSTQTHHNNKCIWWRKIKCWICILACQLTHNNSSCPTPTMLRCKTTSSMGNQMTWKQGLVHSLKYLKAEKK